MKTYFFLPDLFIRCPINAFSEKISREIVEEMLTNTAFLESLYLASPSLYYTVLHYKKGDISSQKYRDKIIWSCAKYILRSRTRATPFGLFSGTGILKWGERTDVNIIPNGKRTTKIDFRLIESLIEFTNTQTPFKEGLRFFPNDTYYVLSNEIRFIEKIVEGGKASFQTSSIEKHDIILEVLKEAESGLKLEELIQILTNKKIEYGEAKEFIEELKGIQLLKSDFEICLTGKEPVTQIIEFLRSSSIEKKESSLLERLENVKQDLEHLDNQPENDIQEYQNIISNFSNTISKSFYTDCLLNISNHPTLNKNIQEELLEAISFVNKLQTPRKNEDLELFKAKFIRRFGNDEIPFLEALDPTVGVGYGLYQELINAPLIKGIEFQESNDSTIHESNSSQLKEIFDTSIRESLHEIKLDYFQNFESKKEPNLSPSTSVIFRLLDNQKVFLEGVGGSSAINLTNRFSESSIKLQEIQSDISSIEDQKNSDVIIAEIIHLPEAKLGNVLKRMRLKKYEIPLLTKSNSTQENQVQLRDLLISVRENHISLKDKRRDKYIIPRLSSAHNFGKESLGIYKFLCDLQFQNHERRITFKWPFNVKDYPFLPRVTYKNVILRLASWQLNKERLKALGRVTNFGEFNRWKEKNGIPNFFLVSEGDNELFIDSQNEFLVGLFIDLLKSKSHLEIKEFIPPEKNSVKNENGLAMLNQFVAPLIRASKAYHVRTENIPSSIHKDFEVEESLDQKWIYVKLYCSPTKVDEILNNHFRALIENSLTKKMISKWFFIKYQDPDFHLRIRFEIQDDNSYQCLKNQMTACIKELLSSEIIWKAENATYEPETERYQDIGLHIAEALFFKDSYQYLLFISGNLDENYRWLFALRSIDQLLTAFEFDLEDKEVFIKKMRSVFANEFGLNQDMKKQLDKKYRLNRTNIQLALSGGFSEIEEILKKARGKTIVPVLSTEDQLKALSGIIHMTVNRIASTQPRLHELIIYDFLSRHYKSEQARKKQ